MHLLSGARGGLRTHRGTPNYNTGLWKVSAAGGPAEELTTPDATDGTLGHWWPQALPDGKTVLFTAFSSPAETSRIVALSLDSMQQKTVVEGGSFGRYAPTGHLVFARQDALMAVPFEPSSASSDRGARPRTPGCAFESIEWEFTVQFLR